MISQKRLEQAFPGKGKELRELLTKKRKTTDYESVNGWLKQCYNKPTYQERLEVALNEILEGFGAEALFTDSKMWPTIVYINMGDCYVTTLLYDYDKGNWYLTTYGDYIENDKRFRE